MSVHDVTNKILWRDSNYIVDVVMRPHLEFFEKSYHNFNFIRIWPEKMLF